MNKALLLKEMGISTWKTKATAEYLTFNSNESESVMTTQEFPVWTLIFEEDDVHTNLSNNIQVVVQNFGVKTQILPFEDAKNAGKIQDLVMVISIEIPQDEQKIPNIEYHPNNSV